MKSSEAIEIVGDLASQQWGLVTSTQARHAGIDPATLRRLVLRGVLLRIRHGVYAHSGTPLSSVLETKAQWLALQPEIMAADRISDPDLDTEVVSHTTAAEIWEVGDLWPGGIHFTTKDQRRSRQSDVRFHRGNLSADEWIIHPDTGLPITTIPRTIDDLADAGYEAGYLLTILDDAASKSLVDRQELSRVLTAHSDLFTADSENDPIINKLLDTYFPTHTNTDQLSSASSRGIAEEIAKLPQVQDALKHIQQIAATAAANNPNHQKFFADLLKTVSEGNAFVNSNDHNKGLDQIIADSGIIPSGTIDYLTNPSNYI